MLLVQAEADGLSDRNDTKFLIIRFGHDVGVLSRCRDLAEVSGTF